MDRADVAIHRTGFHRLVVLFVDGRALASTTRRGRAPPVSWAGATNRERSVSAGNGPRPHKPALFADLTAMIDAAGGSAPPPRAEIAAATAAVVLRAGREPGDGTRFVSLADEVGIDTLAALWRDAEPVSLPGALWALYLLRQWFRTNGEEVRRLWQAGEPFATPDAVVAGMAEPGDVPSVHNVADAVLGGAYRGDFAVALERAA